MNRKFYLLWVAVLTSVSSLFASETITLSTGATLEIFQADVDNANGCAIIACPGGGYAYRADAKEGTDWAPFMNERGYTLAVLKYRLPGGNHSWPLADGRAALKYLRDNASSLHLDPAHVGVMGCSAGGHLASTIATHTEGEERPAFQILFYPVITMNPGDTHQGSIDELLGANPSAELIQEYSNQLHVDANAPRAYITYSTNDGTVAPATNGKAYYDALVAKNVPVTLKTYSTGGHGWSPGDKLGETLKAEMQAHFSNWLHDLESALGIAEIPEDLSESVYSRAAVGEWTEADKADWNASSAVEVNAENGLGANANMTATYVYKSFTIGKDYKVTYEVDWTFATATGRPINWNWIQFGDFLRIGINSTYNMQVSTDAGASWNETALGYYYNNTYTKHIKVVFNTATQTVESLWFDGMDRTALVTGTFEGKAFNSVSTGFVRGGSVGWTLNNYLTTLVITQKAKEAEPVQATVTWPLSAINQLSESTVESAATGVVTSAFALGSNLSATATMSNSGAADGYTAVTYDPPFVQLTPSTRVTARTAGHVVTFTVTPATDHTFTPTAISFDAVKCGTDGGNFDVCYQVGTSQERALATGVSPLRNKVAEGNPDGCSHHTYTLSKVIAPAGTPFQVKLYVYNFNGQDNENPKSIAFRNVTVTGVMDEPVSEDPPRPAAQPMNRGLMAVKTSAGVLVSWRYRAADIDAQPRFRLYRNNKLIGSNPITERTTYLDASGTVQSVYKLEVLDADGHVTETQEGVKPWDNQTKYITLEGGAPTDPTSAGATYTPNDASFCDMDGDGAYDIILKWVPSNEKDAASSGTTSPAFYACYKLDGTRLWMLHTGHNMFNSAHTTPFIAWDLDGDGYGEFMVKTAPGAIDGKGNYVILDGDEPTANLKSGRGKQDHGSEYITVFDGMTGAELKTIKYHTAYGDESTGFWGDSNQNRSERYLAAIAWLDGEDKNPSAIFARGYYSGCKIGAYDWDGEELTLRWLHRGESASKGTVTYANGTVKNLTSTVYGEGAHWISVGDVTGDGRQEIHYGSGALKPDGTTLYRTGFGHGDALHLSDFMPSRPGLELFMAHEHDPYGVDMRDAATGKVIFRTTAGGDTGRGLIGHFNAEADDAYWQSSAEMSNIYDTTQKLIASNVSHGGGGSLNNRIFWNGDLADDYYDKSVLEYWNAEANGFWRMQVNGGNYTIGNLNNSSKYNPCVLGDLLGDWREEIVTWDQSGNDYRLIINATDYTTDYTMPHLMDDYAYRAQVINQNCAYNQPPHVSYDPIARYTIQRTVPESGWDAMYTAYPVSLPDGIIAYNVTGVNAAADTLRTSRLKAGATIPAGASIIYQGTPGQVVSFRPSTKSAASVSANYLKGCSVDSLLTSREDTYEYFYDLRRDEQTGGLGFFKIEGSHMQAAGTAWLRVKGSASNVPLQQYYVGRQGYPVIDQIKSVHDKGLNGQWYDLGGRPANDHQPGLKVQKGKKQIIKR